MEQKAYTNEELADFKNDLRKYKEIGNKKVLSIAKRLQNANITVE